MKADSMTDAADAKPVMELVSTRDRSGMAVETFPLWRMWTSPNWSLFESSMHAGV